MSDSPRVFKLESFRKGECIAVVESHSIFKAVNKENGEECLLYQYNFLKTSKNLIDSFINKVKKVYKLSHPCLLPILGVILPKVDSQEQFYTVCKPAANGNLIKIIDEIKIFITNKPFLTPAQVVTIIYGIASGMNYLHSNNVVHGELQPETILFNEKWEPLIGNYGIVQGNPARKREVTDIRTQMFLSPEMYNPQIKKMTRESDIYAFGMLCFRILSKRNVFDKDANSISFAQNIIEGHRLMIPSYVYPFLGNMIEVCWAQLPNERPAFSKILLPLRNGIETYTPKLNKEAFNKFCRRVDLTDGEFSDSNPQTMFGPTPVRDNNSTEKSMTLTKSMSMDFSMLGDTQRATSNSAFTISLFNLSDVRGTKEYKDLLSIKELKQSERDRVIKILILQDLLLQLDATVIKDSVKWILKNLKFADKDDAMSFVSNLILAAKYRFKNIRVFAQLMLKLYQNDSPQTNTKIVKEMYKTRVFYLMSHAEPHPSLTSNVALLRECYKIGVYTIEEIIEDINYFFYKKADAKRLVCLVFAWFAEEIFEHDKNLYDDIICVFEQNSKDPFFQTEYISFYKILPKLKENNWEKFRNNVSLVDYDPLYDALINDDLDLMIDTMKSSNIRPNSKLFTDPYELCQMAHGVPNLIMYAAVYGSLNIFQYLKMKVNPTLQYKDSIGNALPIFAAGGGSVSITRLTEQQIKDTDGALQASIAFHQSDVYNFFITKKYSLTDPDRNGKLPMVVAAASNNIYAMIDMINRGVSPNDCEVFDITPLHAAASAGNIDATHLLVSLSNVDINAPDAWGITPLHKAADKRQVETMKILLHCKNINVNARTEMMKTPLHVAVETNFPDVVELLLNCDKVEVNALDRKGATPLHSACKLMNHDIIKLFLMRKDVDVSIRDNKGRTPYMISVEKEDEESIEMFELRASSDEKSCRI